MSDEKEIKSGYATLEFRLGCSPEEFLTKQDEFIRDLAEIGGVLPEEITVLEVRDAPPPSSDKPAEPQP